MKSITIHKMENELYYLLQQRAEEYGLSLNKTVKRILRDSLDLDPFPKKRIDLSDIAGQWSQEELKEFEDNTADLDEIDLSEW